jgi:PAS domain-containing protein
MSEAGFGPQITSENLDALRSLLTQGTFIVDGYIDPGTAPDRFMLDIPVMPGQPGVRVSLELRELREYLAASESHRSVFAFRVADVRHPSDTPNNVWTVDVDPQSFVLFTSSAHCEQLGWPVEDSELRERLQHQRNFVEGSAEWTQRHERITQQQLAQEEH